MSTRAWQTGSRPARVLYLLTLATIVLSSAVGRHRPGPTTGDRHVDDGRSRPRVDRDYSEIHDGRTLRVLIANSSSSYYVLRGVEYGFEYELADRIAEQLDLHLQVVLPEPGRTPVEMLQSGRVDVIAMPLTAEQVRGAEVSLTVPYHTIQQRLVVHRDRAESIRGLSDLAGLQVAARRFSAGERELARLRRLGVDVVAVLYGPEVPQEEILDLVADDTYPAAIALDIEVEAAQRFRDELRASVALGPKKDVRWAVRSNSPELLERLDRALSGHVHRNDDGQLVGSEFYNVIRARYFEDNPRMERHQSDPFLLARTGHLSPYDDLFRRAAHDTGLDWRLLAAVAFQESRFDPTAVSWAGAHGLMQLRPQTAGVSADRLSDPEVNVPLGAAHLRELHDHYAHVPEPDRMRFALAAYNCGMGHLDDARTLSRLLGRDPDVWEGSVRESLLLLRKPAYHRMVRYGYVRGNETVAYVREIEQRFERLRSLAPKTGSTRFASQGGPAPTEATPAAAGAPGLD